MTDRITPLESAVTVPAYFVALVVAVHTPIDNCKTSVFQGSGNMRAAPCDIGCCVFSITEALPVSSNGGRCHSGLFFERFRPSKVVNC